jgi:cystathionine beta-lyase
MLVDTHMRFGVGVAGNDAELVLRGLHSMALRYEAQDRSTRELARWMATRPEVATVLHPSLPGSPGHLAWARDARGAACLFSVVFQPRFTQAQVDRFCDRLDLFRLGWSWAGPISLCAPYDVPAIRRLPWPHQGALVRFAIGLEAVDDLRQDIEQALQTLQG